MNYYILAFKKYIDFSGRATRSEYWYFALLNFIVAIIAGVVGTALGFMVDPSFAYLNLLYILVAIIPGIAVTVRRLHDINRSGWYILLGFIPLINLLLIIYMVRDSNPGENQYGPNPKEAIESVPVPEALVETPAPVVADVPMEAVTPVVDTPEPVSVVATPTPVEEVIVPMETSNETVSEEPVQEERENSII